MASFVANFAASVRSFVFHASKSPWAASSGFETFPAGATVSAGDLEASAAAFGLAAAVLTAPDVLPFVLVLFVLLPLLQPAINAQADRRRKITFASFIEQTPYRKVMEKFGRKLHPTAG
jgi:hypothetical protein